MGDLFSYVSQDPEGLNRKNKTSIFAAFPLMINTMRFSAIISLLFLFPGTIVQAEKMRQNFDRSVFYAAMSSDKLDVINSQLVILKGLSLIEKEAFEGALLMRKSGLVKTAKEKLDLFKTGRIKLEKAISKNKDNIEFRFLRVIIQENAPKIVKYKKELEADAKLIRTNFKDLSAFLQQVINDYSKTSTVLKTPL